MARKYVRAYYKFVGGRTNITSSVEAKELMLYSLKQLFNVSSVEYNKAIVRYGDDCVAYLKERKICEGCIGYEESIQLINICEGYADAIGILRHKSLVGSRLERVEEDE